MSIGQRIKAIRIQQGITIDELAHRLGKNRTTIYRYENGDIENLPLGILDCLAETLNTTPAHLLGWVNDEVSELNDPNVTLQMNHVIMWTEEFKGILFTKEENLKLMEYARFLISLREK